jgi:hypothetical protein
VITTLSMMLCEDGHGALFPDNYFSLITLNHNAQAHSNCEHLEGWMSRGPGKFQRLLWQILLDHGRPITVAEICGRAQVGDSRERRVRRALQGMVNHGVAVATGAIPVIIPLTHSLREPQHRPDEREERRRCSQQISPRIEMVVNADAEDILGQ